MPNAYLTINRISGDPDELLAGYRRTAETMAGVGRDHGLIFHAVAKTEDGLMITNLWPSKEGSEAASRDGRRLAVVADHGLEPGQMSPQHFDVEELIVFDASGR